MLLKPRVYLLSEVILSLKKLYFLNTSKFKIIAFTVLFFKGNKVHFVMFKSITFYANVVKICNSFPF